MINLLSNDTIQKIAAGEVIERPASIVKELVENSIDAGAENISVEIIDGGKSYIRVSDDGHGIKSDEIELAFTRHATSKIKEFDDLYSSFSMGFRGEALASIIAVSKVTVKTKNVDEDLASHVEFDNNKIVENKSIAMNNGTSIEVFDLFKYIPVRQKFLSSDLSEANKITQLMYIFAIGNPHISFTYIRNNREVFKTSNKSSRDINYETMFGKDFIENSIDLSFESNHYKVNALVSNNKIYKGNRSMQFVYVNGRYIENKDIADSIERAYSNLIPSGRFPLYDIKIEVDPSLIDVNIHPNKQRIKFSYLDELTDVLYKNIYDGLMEANLPKNIKKLEKEDKLISFYDLNQGDGYKQVLDAYKEPADVKDYQRKENEQLENFFEGDSEKIDDFGDFEDHTDFTWPNMVSEYESLEVYDNNTATGEEENIQISFDLDNEDIKAIIFNRYILIEDFKNDQLKIVDINRAKQKLIYESSVDNKENISQDLLKPIIVNLSNSELNIFEENKNLFNDLGYDIDLFDESSIAIRSIPYYFDQPSNIENFKSLLDDISSYEKDRKGKILRSSIAMASSGANNLSLDQCQVLIKELSKLENPYTTENGQNIIYNLSRDEFINILNK
ncbi:DNA mismatch repair endonuclease MutL [uncultured Helcococcus sp.]|uniref:DNA mismatch repair endonuclease MutL n=1 Tax=uncultured Helcococcus sp. TaxID=1072508 RepID=UPI00261A9E1F|nr:DNA mismatch repair endonuclease MutL [uncultured Helcococcus sp.]